MLSTGTGILLVFLLQALTVPLDSPLPWMGERCSWRRD